MEFEYWWLLGFPIFFGLGWLAARQFADDRNVIALWRILVGVPLFVIWINDILIGIVIIIGSIALLIPISLPVTLLALAPLLIVGVACAIGIPVGIGAGIYLAEFGGGPFRGAPALCCHAAGRGKDQETRLCQGRGGG